MREKITVCPGIVNKLNEVIIIVLKHNKRLFEYICKKKLNKVIWMKITTMHIKCDRNGMSECDVIC